MASDHKAGESGEALATDLRFSFAQFEKSWDLARFKRKVFVLKSLQYSLPMLSYIGKRRIRIRIRIRRQNWRYRR